MDKNRTKAPESEIRLIIHDFKQFKQFIDESKPILLKKYEFTDHFYRPKDVNNRWTVQDLEKKALRLRRWKKPFEKSLR